MGDAVYWINEFVNYFLYFINMVKEFLGGFGKKDTKEETTEAQA